MQIQGDGEGDDAGAADDVVDLVLYGPAGGLGGFEFEAGSGAHILIVWRISRSCPSRRACRCSGSGRSTLGPRRFALRS